MFLINRKKVTTIVGGALVVTAVLISGLLTFKHLRKYR